jgi:hypothetical protein
MDSVQLPDIWKFAGGAQPPLGAQRDHLEVAYDPVALADMLTPSTPPHRCTCPA